MIFREELIERGKHLSDLSKSPDFEPLLEEIKARIEDEKDKAADFPILNTRVDTNVAILNHIARYQALRDILAWIDDAIEDGAREFKRKQEHGDDSSGGRVV